MKVILILCANLIAIVYFILFFVDNGLLPKEPILKVRNILFVCMLLYISHNVLYIYILKKEKAESGLVYKIALGTKNSASKLYNFIRPFQKELLTWTLIAAGIALLSFVLLGLPGAFLLEIPQRLGIGSRIGGDNAWPAALFISIIWPFFFPTWNTSKALSHLSRV